MTNDEISDRYHRFSLAIDEEVSRLFRKIDLDDDLETQLEDLKDEFRDQVFRLFCPDPDDDPDDQPADLRIYKGK